MSTPQQPTAGEWLLEPPTDLAMRQKLNVAWMIRASRQVIAFARFGDAMPFAGLPNVSEAEAKSNGLLIAAAPNLLAAAKEALEFIRSQRMGSGNAEPMLLVAIAKAEEGRLPAPPAGDAPDDMRTVLIALRNYLESGQKRTVGSHGHTVRQRLIDRANAVIRKKGGGK